MPRMPQPLPAKTPAQAKLISEDKQIPAAAAAASAITDVLGDSASGSAMAKLESALSDLRAIQVAPFLNRALEALRREDAAQAADWAIKALEKDERNGLGWQILGIAREKAGDFVNALQCFESALALLPNGAELANDIGRLAYRLGMNDVAAKLFAHFWTLHPELPDGGNNLACVLREEHRFEEAIDALKATLAHHPENPLLWNSLGSVVRDQGDAQTAIVFFDETLRLDPHFAKARYNRANAKLVLGDIDGALHDVDAALATSTDPAEMAMMKMARSTILLCLGRIGEGWDQYEIRFEPQFSAVTHFMIDRPRWTPQDDLAGKSLLVMGEQGLGDEALFANLVPDLIDAVGPAGKVSIAVEPRLVTLFQRSFPTAAVGAHATYDVNLHKVRGAPFVDQAAIDCWTPIGTPLRKFRRTLDAFRPTGGYLKPDAARIAHWREVLKSAPAGRKVGLLWKSMSLQGSRRLNFSPFEAWAPVLQTPGVSFINLQYGDCDAELAMAREAFGVDVWTPPGIDLKQDLDDLTALCCALDLIVGFSNATTSLAGAAGAPLWLIAASGAWTSLGSDRYPWYPQARLFKQPVSGDWPEVMQQVADDLAATIQGTRPAA